MHARARLSSPFFFCFQAEHGAGSARLPLVEHRFTLHQEALPQVHILLCVG